MARRRRLVGRIGALALALAAGAAGAAGDAALVERGRAVYNARCYFCHGYAGDARTLAATYLRPAPRDFTQGPPLSAAQIARTVRDGRAATAMKPFATLLSEAEIAAVAAFVEHGFVRRRARNTTYHTPANGWPDHGRYRSAFPFATGAVALDTPVEQLDRAQQAGRRLFLAACVSCHDRARVADEGPAWSARPLSFPRMGFVPGQVDAVSSASVYAKHDVAPRIEGLDAKERRGEALFQANCAFCHGADGTGRNWIGQFMEPKARDLTAFTRAAMPPARLRAVIRDGLPDTSMPAWRTVLEPAEIDAVAAYVQRAFVGRGTAAGG